jgi:hypothetical protein
MLKITGKVIKKYSHKRIRKGYCQNCGCKLSDPKSIECGFGKRCLANNTMIIMTILPDNEKVSS